jgi:hypothetical protein
MSKSKPGKFPSTLYVVREEEANGESHWYNPAEKKEEHAEVGETKMVAEYQRVRVFKLSANIREEEIETPTKKKGARK